MKYYIYISDQKVDMLACQIPEKKLKSIAKKFNFSIKLPWIPINATYKPGDAMPSDSDRIRRLEMLENAIDQDEIGDIYDSRPWIKATLNMSWGFIDDEKLAIWFVGRTNDTTIVMGGSAKHLLGTIIPEQQPHHAYSLLPILSTLIKDYAESIVGPAIHDNVFEAARILAATIRGEQEQLSFLARRLKYKTDDHGSIILATPLYVTSTP